MLIAIALSGLAAAFAMPIILSNDEDEDDTLNIEPSDDETGGGDLLLDDPTESEGLLEVPDAPPDGEVFDVLAEPGDHEFEEFHPDVDTCRLQLSTADAFFSTGAEDDGTPEVAVKLADGGEFTLTFPGLSDVPGDAIEVIVPAADGGDPLHLTLNEVLALGAETDEDTDEVFVFDWWDESDDHPMDDPLDDMAEWVTLQPEPGDDIDEPEDQGDDLQPIAPGGGDDVDDLPEPLEEYQPIAPGGGDDVDPIPEPLVGVPPVAPNPGDEY